MSKFGVDIYLFANLIDLLSAQLRVERNSLDSHLEVHFFVFVAVNLSKRTYIIIICDHRNNVECNVISEGRNTILFKISSIFLCRYYQYVRRFPLFTVKREIIAFFFMEIIFLTFQFKLALVHTKNSAVYLLPRDYLDCECRRTLRLEW